MPYFIDIYYMTLLFLYFLSVISAHHIFDSPTAFWCCLTMTWALAEQSFNHRPRLHSAGAMTVSKMNLMHIVKKAEMVPAETLWLNDGMLNPPFPSRISKAPMTTEKRICCSRIVNMIYLIINFRLTRHSSTF